MLATEKRFKIQAVRYFEYKTAKNFKSDINDFGQEAKKNFLTLDSLRLNFYILVIFSDILTPFDTIL